MFTVRAVLARSGAAGTVVTVQTAAQAAEVRALMRKAGVTARAAAAGKRRRD